MSRTDIVQFANVEIAGWLESVAEPHESRGQAASRLLGLLRAIVDDELQRARLLPEELNLIADALQGTFLDTTTLRYLWAEIDDSLADGLAEKWNVDGPALVGRLREMSLAALAATVVAARGVRQG